MLDAEQIEYFRTEFQEEKRDEAVAPSRYKQPRQGRSK